MTTFEKTFEEFEYVITTVLRAQVGYFLGKMISVKRYLGNKTEVVVPERIEGLPVVAMNETFLGNENVESVILPKSLERIGSRAFGGCHKLKTVHITSSLMEISDTAFKNCTSLEEITLSDDVESLENWEVGYGSFENCPKLCDEKGFIILKTLLLSYQGSATQVTIPDGITKISNTAFRENHVVTLVVMPDSVTTMEDSVFAQCSHLKEITLSKELRRIGKEVFLDCEKLEQIRLPEHVNEMGRGAFFGCVSLKEVQWSKNLLEIPEKAFQNCTSLEEISFPDALTTIKNSFYGCKNLRKINIPLSVKTISKKAFEKCESLEEIIILKRPETGEPLELQTSCFSYNGKMRENLLEKGKEIPVLVASSFVKKERLQYYRDLLSVWGKLSHESKDIFREGWKKKISGKVKIGKNSLRNLVFLQSTAKEMAIYFDEGFHLELSEFQDYLAFSIEKGHTAETAVLLDYKNKMFSAEVYQELETRREMIELGFENPTLEELCEKWVVKVKKDHIEVNGYLGKNAEEVLPASLADGTPISSIQKTYDGFKGLTHLTLSEGLEEIGLRGFHKTALEVIHLPDTVKTIGRETFRETKIKEITLPATLNHVDDALFQKCERLEKVTFPEKMETIGVKAFENCCLLTELHIPDGVIVIHREAFNSCFNLKTVTLPESLLILGGGCFQHCIQLEEIRLPAGMEVIKSFCFYNCTNLKKVILPSESVVVEDSVWGECPSLKFIGAEGGENLLYKWKYK